MGCVRRSSALPPARVSSPLAHPALHPPSWEAPLRPQTHSHTPRPSCSSLRQHLPGVRQVLSSGRSSAQGASSPSLRGNILSPTAHRLGTLRQPRALSSRLPGNSSNNNSGSGSSGSQGIKAPGTSTTELPAAQPKQAGPSAPQQSRPLGLKEYHYATFFTILLAGVGFLAVLLYLQAGIEIQQAVGKVLKRLLKTVALRQVMGILAAMTFVRFGLEPLMRFIRRLFMAPGTWEKSAEYFILREVYQPLEFLFTVAAFTTLIENFLPQLIALPKALIQSFVRSTLTLTFVIAAARVVFSIKARVMADREWQLELSGEVTKQRRIEAVDKLLSVLTLIVAAVFGLQAIGLDVNSVLAIGGVGGLAVGLAGREILENLFTGLIILSSSPFEVGEEINFTSSPSRTVEGIVVDVGWYRTTIRSFERELYTIPNSVFSRNVVLNITRKNKEWRFFEFFGVRVEDVKKIESVVSDMRKFLRQHPRIIQRLHRRVFLDGVNRDQLTVYISCYVDATNRDAFMAVRQDIMIAFIELVHGKDCELARTRLGIEVSSAMQPALGMRTDPETRPASGKEMDTIMVTLPSTSQASEDAARAPAGDDSSPSIEPKPSSGPAAEQRDLQQDQKGPRKDAPSSGDGRDRRREGAPGRPPEQVGDAVNVVPRERTPQQQQQQQRSLPAVTPDMSYDAEQMGGLVTASFDEIPSRAGSEAAADRSRAGVDC